MKTIKLFLLISIGLWAEFKLNIPNEVDTEDLQYIVENGWNDKNQTLNDFIIKYGQKVYPTAFKKMQKPMVIVNPTKDNPDPFPIILLYRNDYRFIFSYLKYLESIGELDNAIQGYYNALKGFPTIKHPSMISVIYRLAVGQIVVNGLEQAIRSKRFSSQQIKEIKNEVEKYLLLDNKMLWDAFQYEINGSDKLLRRGLQLDITEQEKLNLIRVAEIRHALRVNFYQKCWELETVEEQEKFIQTMKHERDTFLDKYPKEIAEFNLLTWDYIGSQYAKLWKGGKGSSKKDKEFVKSISDANHLKQKDVDVEIGAKYLFYISAFPETYIQFKQDIDNHIVKNKEFIKSLEK